MSPLVAQLKARGVYREIARLQKELKFNQDLLEYFVELIEKDPEQERLFDEFVEQQENE